MSDMEVPESSFISIRNEARAAGIYLNYRPERQCRICGIAKDNNYPHAELVEDIVNTYLSKFRIAKDVLQAIEGYVAYWPEEHRPSMSTIYRHRDNHLNFNVSAARKIIAKKHQETLDNAQDEVITLAGLLELVVREGAARLARGEIEPTLAETVQAQKALEESLNTDSDGSQEVIQLRDQFEQVIWAINGIGLSDEQIDKFHELLRQDRAALTEGTDPTETIVEAEPD